MFDTTTKSLLAMDLNQVINKYGVKSAVFVIVTDREVFQLCGTANDGSGQTIFTQELSKGISITLNQMLGRNNEVK